MNEAGMKLTWSPPLRMSLGMGGRAPPGTPDNTMSETSHNYTSYTCTLFKCFTECSVEQERKHHF